MTTGVILHGSREGHLYVTSGDQLYRGSPETGFDRLGTLPVDRSVAFLAVERYGIPIRAILNHLVGRFLTHSLHPAGGGRLVLTTGQSVLISDDDGRSWCETHQLPASSPPFGVLPSAITSHDGSIYVGEYPQSPGVPARLLVSHDGGWTWQTHEITGIRHIHGVQGDPYSGGIWVTTGDTDEECKILRLIDGSLSTVGGGSQDWRAVELAFTPDAILWGVDCPYKSNNPLFVLDRDGLEAGTPSRVHAVDGSVFYSATAPTDEGDVVYFSTAVETGRDSTAPGRASHHAAAARVVAGTSADGYETWRELAQFPKRRVAFDALSPTFSLTANAYIHLIATGDQLVINPINTAIQDGALLRIDSSSVTPTTRPAFNPGIPGR